MPRIIHENLYKEGVYDPAIFKAVFIVGGPGSGKSFAVKKLALQSLGLVPLNSDVAFEYLMKKGGLSFKMPDEEQTERDIVRSRAKLVAKEKTDNVLDGRLGVIVEGTGYEYDKVIKIKDKLELLGYECFMVVINTRLDVAKIRNAKRERSIPEKLLIQKWTAVQDNLGKFANAFENFIVLDNNEYSEEQVNSIYKKISSFVKEAPKKPQAKKWIEDEKRKKSEKSTKNESMKKQMFEQVKKLQKIAGILKENEDLYENSGLVVRSLGGDPYDAGIAWQIEKDGQVIHNDIISGDNDVQYNGQSYPNLKSLSDAIGAEFVVEPGGEEDF
jgi:cytidylate kinase